MKMKRTLVYEGNKEFIDLHIDNRYVKSSEGPRIFGGGGTITETLIRFPSEDAETEEEKPNV